MFKNVASQKIQLFAFDTTTGAAKTGDAANITAYVAKDYGSVTVLGDTSATEMDATNAKGWYLFDLTQGETNADCLLFTGKSSTSNISIVGQVIYTLPASFTSFVTPTNLTAAQIATGVWQDTTAGDFTTALSVGKSVMNGVALGTGLTINAYTGNTAQTGDSFARLGAPAGASVSADVAAINAKTTNLPAAPASTTNITAATGIDVTKWVGGTVPAVNVTGVPLVDLKYTLGTISPAAAGSVRADAVTGAVGSVTGAVGSVTGAVGSVTGNVGGNVVGSVASVTAGVTVTTSNDKTGYALTSGERTSIADAMLDEANGIETAWTVRKVLRILFAGIGGKASGLATTTAVYRAGDDSKARITATVDADGNRSAVTLDGT